jgi:hypothetical protein
MKSPVLFLIFNRPETTIQVFEKIRAARPPKLYISADGPRSNRPGELERCEAARKIETIIWVARWELLLELIGSLKMKKRG